MLEWSKLLVMMNIYIAKPFSAKSSLWQQVRALQANLSVHSSYRWKEVALPYTQLLFEEVYKQNHLLFPHILGDADVLILDRGIVEYDIHNSNTPFFSELVENRVLFIVCSESESKPTSPDKLNLGIDQDKLLLLEYEKSIVELQDYILNAIAKHGIFLQTTKPLQKM